MSNKTYVGNAKTITTAYGDLLKISMTSEDISKLQSNLDNGWINLVVKQRREPSKGGMTHYLEVDNWKPDNAKGSTRPTETKPPETQPGFEQDMPF